MVGKQWRILESNGTRKSVADVNRAKAWREIDEWHDNNEVLKLFSASNV